MTPSIPELYIMYAPALILNLTQVKLVSNWFHVMFVDAYFVNITENQESLF